MKHSTYFGIFLGFALLVAGMTVSPGDTTSSKVTQKAKALVTFIELGSDKCVPCIMMRPVMEEIRKQYGDQVQIIFYDVWTEEGQPYARQYRIRAIPTQVFLDAKGEEYFRHEGYFPAEQVGEVLSRKGAIKQ